MSTTMEAPTEKPSSKPAAATGTPGWFSVRQNQYLALGIGVAVIALIIYLVIATGQRKEEFAARQLEQARTAAESGNLPLASSELQKLITGFPGTEAAKEAVITLNQVRMVNGQGELAVVGLQDFLKSNPDPKFAAPAYGLLGAALENSKRPIDAAQAYLSASKAADVDYLKASYLVEAGRAFRTAGKTEESIAAYRRVVNEFSKTTLLTEATVRLAELTKGKM